MKKLAIMIPPFLVLSLMMAPSALAQSSYVLEPGDSITHEGQTYTLIQLVGGQNCKLNVGGVLSSILVVGDVVGDLRVTKISEAYVTLEAELPDEEGPEDDEENLPEVSFRLELDDGNILVFTDSGGTNGAMGYAFGMSEHPTFLFWSGGNLPGVAKTPPPIETVTIPVGRSYTPQMVPGLGDLVVTVENTDGTRVIVAFETDDSVNIMKTTIGPTDWAELVDKLMSDALAKIPDAPIVPPTDMTAIAIPLWGFLILAGVLGFLKYRAGWGQRGSGL